MIAKVICETEILLLSGVAAGLTWAWYGAPLWRKSRALVTKSKELKQRNTLWKACYGQPTDDDVIALVLEKQEEDRLHILKCGRVMLSPLTNCAPGTWGHLVMGLASEGLMQWHPIKGSSVYIITPKGRDYLERVKA
jgi:predicted transcriptional regulator